MTTEDFDFALWLQEFGHGAANRQASEQLCQLIKACRETGKAGSLQITIKAGAADQLAELKASIKTTMPQPSLPGGSYYVTADGALVTEDPRQLNLPAPRVLDLKPVKKGDPQ